jgi:hypothetical protein
LLGGFRVSFLLALDKIEGRLKATIGRLKGDLRAWKGLGSLERILKAAIGRLESLEERLESLEGRLKAAICESLEGILKAAIVMFNDHWRAKEAGS